MIFSFGFAAMSQDADDSNFSAPSLNDLISLREAAKPSGLSPSHLRLLVSWGDIWGLKLGRNWVTTAKAVEEYLARQRRAGLEPTVESLCTNRSSSSNLLDLFVALQCWPAKLARP